MKKWSLYIPLVAVVALASCRKELPLAEPGSPEFYVNAKVEGADLSLSAGDDGYYMHTNYLVENGITHLIGYLGSNEPNTPSWTIEFASDKAEGAINVDSVLAIGDKSLESSDVYTKSSIVNIVPNVNFGMETREIQTVFWRFNFGGVVPVETPVFPFDTANYNGVLPLVTVGSRFDNQHNLQTTRCVDVYHPNDWASFEVEVIQTGIYRFYVPPYFQSSVNQVYWDVNGVAAAQGDTFLYRLPSSTAGDIFNVTAGFRHASGARTCQSRDILVYESTARPPRMDFTYKVQNGGTLDTLHLNTVKITYTTAEGKVYTSALHHAPGSITITDVLEYLNDIDGRSTKKVSLKGSFLLQDATGDELHIDDAEFVIAVATSDP